MIKSKVHLLSIAVDLAKPAVQEPNSVDKNVAKHKIQHFNLQALCFLSKAVKSLTLQLP